MTLKDALKNAKALKAAGFPDHNTRIKSDQGYLCGYVGGKWKWCRKVEKSIRLTKEEAARRLALILPVEPTAILIPA